VIVIVLHGYPHGCIRERGTGKVAIDLAISIDLKRFLVVSISLCLVIKERLVVLEPGADLKVDAGLNK
jgi:hypothetical protein